MDDISSVETSSGTCLEGIRDLLVQQEGAIAVASPEDSVAVLNLQAVHGGLACLAHGTL